VLKFPLVNKRRSLTPHTGMTAVGARALRRGGARQTVSDRVTFNRDSKPVLEGWALNVSRGGVRAILEIDAKTKVELGDEYDVIVGDPEVEANAAKRGRIVWLQEEPDGFVVGVEYVELSGTRASAPPVEPPADDSK
jgi:hypothetical protein